MRDAEKAKTAVEGATFEGAFGLVNRPEALQSSTAAERIPATSKRFGWPRVPRRFGPGGAAHRSGKPAGASVRTGMVCAALFHAEVRSVSGPVPTTDGKRAVTVRASPGMRVK